MESPTSTAPRNSIFFSKHRSPTFTASGKVQHSSASRKVQHRSASRKVQHRQRHGKSNICVTEIPTSTVPRKVQHLLRHGKSNIFSYGKASIYCVTESPIFTVTEISTSSASRKVQHLLRHGKSNNYCDTAESPTFTVSRPKVQRPLCHGTPSC